MKQFLHLARRFASSLNRRLPGADDVAWVRSHLLPSEEALWSRMSPADRRHSIVVARRFVELVGKNSEDLVPRAEVAGALLHDVGKLVSGLGTFSRVVATIVGPRGRRFAQYHDHERIGVELLRSADSDPVTLALVVGEGRSAEALRAADAI